MRPASHTLPRSAFCLLLALAGLLPLGLAATGPSDAETAPVLRKGDAGEQEQIQRRLEWFYGSRRAGSRGPEELPKLRRAGMIQTREAIETQRRQRGAGLIDAANSWMPMGPAPSGFGGWAFGEVSGRVAAIAADWSTGTIYVGSASGGLWKSTNDGLSWTPLLDEVGTLTVGAVAVDPNNSSVIWAGTGENVSGCESYFGLGLLRSADGGVTWETRNGSGANSLEDLSSFANIVIDPRDSNHIVTGGRLRACSTGSGQAAGLYTSTDAGLSWTRRLTSTQVYEIAQDPSNRDIFWAATNKGVYKSTDNAVSWTLQTATGLPNGDTGRTELAIAPSNTQVVYVLMSNGGTSQPEFWRTADGGGSWAKMSEGSDACDGQCWYNMTLAVDNTDPDLVYRGTVHVFSSFDGGVTWSDLSNNWGSSQKVHQDTHVLLVDPGVADTFWVGCDGGIWKTSDGGVSFINKIGNLSMTQFYAVGVHPTDSGIICGGAQDNSSLARTTSNSWSLQAVTGDGFVCHVDPLNPDYNYIASYPNGGYPNVMRSETGILGSFHGITGSGRGIIGGDRINWVTPYILDPTQPNVLYLGTHRVYRSDDFGDSWTPVSGDLTGGGGNIVALDVNRNFPQVVLASTTDGHAWRSTDGGASWTEISAGLPSRSINDIASDPTNPDRVLAVVGGFNTDHLWEWNAGGSFVAAGAGLPNVPANSVVMLSGEKVFVGVDTGVFESADGGATVAPFMNGMPQGMVVTDLKYNQSMDLLTAGTYGRGAWQATVDPVGPILLYDSIELPMVEADGDGDGSVEPGETWEVRPRLRNVGSATALGVTARLSTATPGVTVLEPSSLAYGDVVAGSVSSAVDRYSFVVDPSFTCGNAIVFDLVDIHSTNDPFGYSDQMHAFEITVVDSFEPPVFSTQLDENFDPPPTGGWTHQAIDPNIFFCNLTYVDEWQVVSKDAAHGESYHCGNGPGAGYSRANDAWLYYGGRDSLGDAGLDLPADAQTITMTVVHWYETEPLRDGGQVAIDGQVDGQDIYDPLVPDGGYPAGKLDTGRCNGLEGAEAFHGSSGGWITSTFDLTAWRGSKIFLAFIFGSDSANSGHEGWYIDQVTVESQKPGQPICQISLWPGTVPPNASFSALPGGQIEASWSDSCNLASMPGQTYAIQEGDLDALFTSGSFSHAPTGDLCSRVSPDSFTPAAGNRYFLVTAEGAGREGSAGSASDGSSRPATSPVCGPRRAGSCP